MECIRKQNSIIFKFNIVENLVAFIKFYKQSFRIFILFYFQYYIIIRIFIQNAIKFTYTNI